LLLQIKETDSLDINSFLSINYDYQP